MEPKATSDLDYHWVGPGSPMLERAREMFADYQRELGIDLCFQGFEEELESLPGKYGPLRGALLLLSDPMVVACGALHPIEESVCEIKRVYVVPSARGRGLGRKVMTALTERARDLGYEKAVLDTLATLEPAIRLYRELGFRETPPYNDGGGHDVVYFELDLTGSSAQSPLTF